MIGKNSSLTPIFLWLVDVSFAAPNPFLASISEKVIVQHAFLIDSYNGQTPPLDTVTLDNLFQAPWSGYSPLNTYFFSATYIPEPGTIGLLGIGFVALVVTLKGSEYLNGGACPGTEIRGSRAISQLHLRWAGVKLRSIV